ncbi:MAG: Sec-independent protein translocase TatA [Flavobacterium sp.]|nr:MAG: Sec-independent protein translocase TatA [Flavobacterium sp.]
MFGIGGGEFIFILFIILIFFGSDKIPEIARTLGKGMAQLKNATNDIKSEIHNSARDGGLDLKELTGGISEEINKAKEGFTRMVNENANSSTDPIKTEIELLREKLAKMEAAVNEDGATLPPATDIPVEGPIKRQS